MFINKNIQNMQENAENIQKIIKF